MSYAVFTAGVQATKLACSDDLESGMFFFFADKRLGIEVVSSRSLQTLQLFSGGDFNGGDERQVVCADDDARLSSNCSQFVLSLCDDSTNHRGDHVRQTKFARSIHSRSVSTT